VKVQRQRQFPARPPVSPRRSPPFRLLLDRAGRPSRWTWRPAFPPFPRSHRENQLGLEFVDPSARPSGYWCELSNHLITGSKISNRVRTRRRVAWRAKASQPGLMGDFGHWKPGWPGHTTCRGRGRQETTSNSAFSGASGFKGFRLQRLRSAVGFGPRMQIGPGKRARGRVHGNAAPGAKTACLRFSPVLPDVPLCRTGLRGAVERS
jgi:hypothetical protein